MGKPVCLLGNMHLCPKVEPGPVPHVGGPIIDAGQNLVTVNGIPMAVVGEKHCAQVSACPMILPLVHHW